MPGWLRLMDRVTALTSMAVRFVYYPFTVLFILIISRNSLFDNWDWPVTLIGIFTSGLLVLVASTVSLQRSAQESKKIALQLIGNEILEKRHVIELALAKKATLLEVNDTGKLKHQAEVDRLEADVQSHRARLDWLNERRNGLRALESVVFQAWHRNPLFRAIMIPIGGIGSVTALEGLLGWMAS